MPGRGDAPQYPSTTPSFIGRSAPGCAASGGRTSRFVPASWVTPLPVGWPPAGEPPASFLLHGSLRAPSSAGVTAVLRPPGGDHTLPRREALDDAADDAAARAARRARMVPRYRRGPMG